MPFFLKKAVTLQIQRHHMLEFIRPKHYKLQGTSVQMYSYPEQKLWRELHGGFYIFTIECIFELLTTISKFMKEKKITLTSFITQCGLPAFSPFFCPNLYRIPFHVVSCAPLFMCIPYWLGSDWEESASRLTPAHCCSE